MRGEGLLKVVAIEAGVEGPDDLGHGHRPPTGTSTQLVIHTRPVTCDFTMHTAHSKPGWAELLGG